MSQTLEIFCQIWSNLWLPIVNSYLNTVKMVTIIIHSKSKYFVYFTSSKWYESFCLAYTIIIIQGIFLPTQLLIPALLLIFDKMPTYTFIPTYMIIRDTRVSCLNWMFFESLIVLRELEAFFQYCLRI